MRALYINGFRPGVNICAALLLALFAANISSPTAAARVEAVAQPPEIATVPGYRVAQKKGKSGKSRSKKSGGKYGKKKKPLFYYAHPIFWAPFILVGDGGGTGKS